MRLCSLAGIAALALAGCNQGTAGNSDAGGAVEPTPTEAPGTATGAPSPTPGASETPGSVEPRDSACGADKLGAWLNTLPSSDILAKVRAAIGHERIRTIAPGEAVDADLRPNRLNIETGVDGRIKRFRCG